MTTATDRARIAEDDRRQPSWRLCGGSPLCSHTRSSRSLALIAETTVASTAPRSGRAPPTLSPGYSELPSLRRHLIEARAIAACREPWFFYSIKTEGTPHLSGTQGFVSGTCRLRRQFDGSRVILKNFRFLFFIKRRRGLPVTLPETIVRRRCAALIPYARNARTHSDQQVAQIAASIREFGFTNPVPIDEGDGIIAGAGRVLGAHCSASTRCRASSWLTSRRRSAAPMCSPTTSWRSTPAGFRDALARNWRAGRSGV